jgi:hypothetical protein
MPMVPEAVIARRDGSATVIATLFVCALSISEAIYLILELDRPFDGLLQISSAPLRSALEHLGQ